MSKAIVEYLAAKDADTGARVLSPAVKLTQAVIDSLPTKPYDYQIREVTVPGLRVRVRAGTGNKIFEVHKKVNGRATTAPICRSGQAPYSKGDESVLVRARAMLAKMDKGVTPAKEKIRARAEAVEQVKLSTTVNDACTAYIKGKTRALNTESAYKRFRDKSLKEWHNRQLTSITEEDIAELHDEITEETGPVAANNVVRFFRAVWKFHRRKLRLGDCPTIIFTKEGDNIKTWNPEGRRTRYIHRKELKAWWKAVECLRSDYVGDGDLAADYLQFGLLTGLRRREITSIKWEDINERRKTFLIAENKSRRPYAAPLTKPLKDILDRRQGEKRPFNIEEPKKFIAKVVELSGVPFSTHDLRRTFLSHGTAVGIPMSILKALVNHSRKQDVTDGYIQIDEDVLRESAEKVQNHMLAQAGQIKSVTPVRSQSSG